MLLEGEFDAAVLREFDHKNIAFEQLAEIRLELTSRVLAFEVVGGEGTRSFQL